jgi:hypothetical protein
MLLLEDDPKLALYFELCVSVWFELKVSTTFIQNWFIITMFKTLMYLWRELLCNLWWWPLNLLRSWLVCKLVWNPSWFHELPGYTGLSLLNRLLGGWFSYLISYNWSVLLQVPILVRVKSINMRKSKLWFNLDHLPRICNSVWSKHKLLHTS